MLSKMKKVLDILHIGALNKGNSKVHNKRNKQDKYFKQYFSGVDPFEMEFTDKKDNVIHLGNNFRNRRREKK